MLKFSPGIKQFLLVFIFFLTTLGFSQTTTIYSENFETGFEGWSISSSGSGIGSWVNGSNVANSSGATGNYVYSQVYGKNSNNDNNTNYNNHTYIIATSPTINTTGYSNITFDLDIWYNTETNWDGMKVEYSLNNGATWSNLGSVNNVNWYNDTDVDAFGNKVDGWSGNSGGWVTKSISLSNENTGFDNNSQVKIRILFASDTYVTDVGVAFDNIIIKSDKYCSSYGSSMDGYKTGIRLVNFNTIDNATPIEDNDYSDFTSISTTVLKGSSYDLTVKVNTDGNYAVGAVVWIDWNQDGDFNDNGEEFNVGYAVNVSNGNTSLSPYNITIPTTANTGPTRMRVSAKFNYYPLSCETEFDGEVEDYTVNLIEPNIVIDNISPMSYCEGDSVDIPYTLVGNYNSGNVFTAQLSDTSGSFASPLTVGTVTSNSNGTISGTIPMGISSGSGYRIRIISNNPSVTGTDNGSNININALPINPTTTDVQVCKGSSGTVLASGAVPGESYLWYDAVTGGTLLKTSTDNTDNSYVTPALSVNIDYWVSILNASGCESSRTKVTANVITVNTWNGSISSDWNTDANWGCKVPSSTNNLDVLIPAGLSTYPTLSSGSTGYVENVEFQLGSTLNVVNNSLRVTKNIKLNGSIYLQAESQLLQDEGSVLDVASTGFIEIDQQGTSDNFKYNYWGSPVGKISTSQNNASYTIATVLRDGTDTNNIKNIDFGASYTYADGGATSPIKLSTYWMYKYANKTSSDYNAWEHLGKDGTLSVGEGFTLKGSNTDQTEQNYTFVGKPNNGTIKLPLSAGGAYLIGNPYPCALDAKQFIRDNISTANGGNRSVDVINGTLYFWDHFGGGTHLLKSYEGGYAIYTLTGSVPAIAINTLVNSTGNSSTKVPQRFIPVAQGFFVEAAAGLTGTEYIQFNNGQRKYKTEQVNTSIFLKNSKKKISNKNSTDEDLFPKIFLEYNSPNGYQREILVGFINSATDSLDVGYDALLNETNEEDMYWKSGKNDMIIQAVKTLDDNRVLPIEIKTAITGVNKISIKSLENIPEGTEIFIKDNSTGETFNITSNPFEINLNAGTYSNRFALSFKTDASLSVFDTILDKELVVFMDNSNSEIKLINNSNIEINSINLYNYLGQQIKIWKTSLNQNRLSLPVKTASGVYIIRINTSKGTINKKIVIE
ncbi:MAG: GEVED domain-containing protein [Lutibacter sp.]|uniref:GEVED domain-containing protein n=1 Tax=Lutibacter sp. TaxID=1925666 RepID=UPI00299DB6D0|nr:GEVED domain-containing protein [Lutibacter sp.]MDX1830131.1 GEVED domain-containing protein [Lutibacter sp.]